MNISDMLNTKEQLGISYDTLSDFSGIPKGTIQKILTGVTQNPRKDTLKILEQTFSVILAGKGNQSGKESRICETAAGYHAVFPPAQRAGSTKYQGEYTIADYLMLPETCRAELIDGVFYDMSSPLSIHQIVSFMAATQIENFIDREGGSCLPFVAPMDVQLDCDEKTMVQPDLFILCKPEKLKRNCIYGAPDFVLEVLSKSTSWKDRHLKYRKYYEAGVREYWIVDPDQRQICVYQFKKDEEGNCVDTVSVYGFEDRIPVGIYDGKLEIDFYRISARIRTFGGNLFE